MRRAVSKLRWMQFSLRSGFLVVTATCVALTLWVVPAETQRRAVMKIQAVGGHVEYAEPDENRLGFAKTTLCRWLPPAYVADVQTVGLYARGNDALLGRLGCLTDLQVLDVGHSNVTDVGLASLQGHTSLRELYLSETNVTDAGIASLRDLHRLHVLQLSQTLITDSALSELRGMMELEVLELSDNLVTDARLAELAALKSLEMICPGLLGSKVLGISRDNPPAIRHHASCRRPSDLGR